MIYQRGELHLDIKFSTTELYYKRGLVKSKDFIKVLNLNKMGMIP